MCENPKISGRVGLDIVELFESGSPLINMYYRYLPFVQGIPPPPYRCYCIHPRRFVSVYVQPRSNHWLKFHCHRPSLQTKILTMSVFEKGYPDCTVRIARRFSKLITVHSVTSVSMQRLWLTALMEWKCIESIQNESANCPE